MLKNKVYIVTGANGRIGSALTDHLIKNGAKVIMADQNVKFNKTNYKKEHLIFKSDLTKEKNIKKLLAEGKKNMDL